MSDQITERRERVDSVSDVLRGESEENEELRQLSTATEAVLPSVDSLVLCSPIEVGGTVHRPDDKEVDVERFASRLDRLWGSAAELTLLSLTKGQPLALVRLVQKVRPQLA